MEDSLDITLNIPSYVKLPVDIREFSKEENALLLMIGINAVLLVKNEYVNKDQDKINREIEKKIRDTFSLIVLEKDRKYHELEELNVTLKKTFEDTTMTTMTNYCEKIHIENTKLADYQEKIHVLEKENMKMEEQLQYREKEYRNRLEIERFNIMKQVEDEMKVKIGRASCRERVSSPV